MCPQTWCFFVAGRTKNSQYKSPTLRMSLQGIHLCKASRVSSSNFAFSSSSSAGPLISTAGHAVSLPSHRIFRSHRFLCAFTSSWTAWIAPPSERNEWSRIAGLKRFWSWWDTPLLCPRYRSVAFSLQVSNIFRRIIFFPSTIKPASDISKKLNECCQFQ